MTLLANRAFRALLTVQLVNAVAVWIHVVAVQWVLTERGESALVISLAPAALAVPFLVLALPAGVVAGYASRKTLMGAATATSAGAALAACLLTAVGGDGAVPMVLSVVLVGAALVVVGVSWQSLLPETVDRGSIPTAAVVDGAVFNLARALGPLIAGVGLGLAGGVWVFALVAAMATACALALWVMERRAPDRTAPRRPILPELAVALRFVANSAWTTRLLVQLVLFGIPSSALWALISLAVHDRLGMGSGGFGGIMALIGGGAVLAAAALGGVRRRLRVKVFAACGAGVYAVALMVLAASTSVPAVSVAMFCVGAAWVSVQSTWMSLGHQFFPDWVRPRLIAVILLMFQGTQAVGALLWGAVSDLAGLETALSVAAGLMVVSAVSLLLVGLGAESGIEPVLHSTPTSSVVGIPCGDGPALPGGGGGPVEVRYTYRVDADRRAEFDSALRALRRSRLRLGGRDWRVDRPADGRGTYVETYRVASVDEFLEQERERLTVPETGLRRRVRAAARSVAGPELRAVRDRSPVRSERLRAERGDESPRFS